MALRSNSPARSGRRIRVRRKLPRQTSPVVMWLREERNLYAVAVLAGFVLVATGIVAWTQDVPREYAGARAERSRVNRVEYIDSDPVATAAKQEEARKAAPRIYVANSSYLDSIRGRIAGLPRLAAEATSLADLTNADAGTCPLDEREFAMLREGAQTNLSARWTEWTDRLIERLATVIPVVDPAEFDAYTLAARRTVVVPASAPADDADPAAGTTPAAPVTPAVALANEAIRLRADEPAAMRSRLEAEAEAAGFPSDLARAAIGPLLDDPRATITFDPAATADAVRRAVEATPPVELVHPRGEAVMVAGDVVTEEQVTRLHAEHGRYMATRTWSTGAVRTAAMAALTAALALLGGMFLSVHEPEIFRSWRRLATFMALALVPALAAALLAVSYPRAVSFGAIGGAMLAAAIVTVAFGLRPALLGILLQTVLLGAALGSVGATVLVALASASVYAVLLREIRHRSTLVNASLAAAAVAGAAALLGNGRSGMDGSDDLVRVLGESLIAVVTGLFVGFVVIGLLPTVERLSGRPTALTLVELRDPKQPLLRELQRRAPGTWNHSLQVANIAESAAEAIGANGLLAYVGALYHDVGKSNKPEYFVENQSGINRHDRLSPAMSLLVIVGHVKDGMELAAEFALPRQVRHFIESHHGTTLMEYFFHAARKRAQDDDLNEADFRYPGPKPSTKETAVLLLCDCVESASRTLSEPTPARIEQLVRDLSHRRLVDGQFDDSPLTLRELRVVEDSIIKSLNAIYHGRISYPTVRGGAREDRAESAAPRAAG
jgi:putative nucleotidyltransferase with HDIG domain